MQSSFHYAGLGIDLPQKERQKSMVWSPAWSFIHVSILPYADGVPFDVVTILLDLLTFTGWTLRLGCPLSSISVNLERHMGHGPCLLVESLEASFKFSFQKYPWPVPLGPEVVSFSIWYDSDVICQSR